LKKEKNEGMRIVALLLLFLGAPWIVYTTWVTIQYARLKRLTKGLKEPELWLPKKERQAHARKLLQREDEQYIQQMIERQTSYMKGENS
jgi:hypothetical protein